MRQERTELFAVKVPAGRRTYYFDVKETTEGARYLVISELQAAGSRYDRHRVMVFEENLQEFQIGLEKVMAFLGVRQEARTYSVDEIRRRYPRAYEKWTTEEEEELRLKYLEGMRTSELADYLQRQPGAIRARLSRLGR